MWRAALLLPVAILSTSCRQSHSSSESNAGLVFLTRDGCVNSDRMLANLDAALRALHRSSIDYRVIDQDTLAKTDVRSGYATPTLLYNSRDVFGLPEPKPPFPEPT